MAMWYQPIFISPWVNIFSLMLVIPPIESYLSPTVVFDTTLQSGAALTPEELFNLRHASARNVIERIFGILKRHFRILLPAPEYDIDIQARIPTALCALHNYIYSFDKGEEDTLDIPLDTDDEEEGQQQSENLIDPHVAVGGTMDTEDFTVSSIHDDIAIAMWTDYQSILAERAQRDMDAISDDESDLIEEISTTL
ncbi:hypothetical protein PISMIDRAFT_17931 [Pisolithus microcarpus 441]|uniref:Unplaced genomic scaffold scaffold_306, whole genome shotgun sequence n=1 Tax=Pisolithus microcarpus 441 TaxID=765257 RepID=A0A0C9Z0J4_9AGAM|nr:hypothetical protein PISMIDRAFT_17931 [Pisolithus microcarpus 441]